MSSVASAEPSLRDSVVARPSRKCDIVMKGGITSGVVYPLAVCELARTYRLQNIGGTSAGAIAAAAAAAAEYGRDKGGFEKLARLPEWLGANLFSLFQPQAGTRRLFETFVAGLGPRRGRFRRVLATACLKFPTVPLLVSAPGAVLAVVAALSGTGFLRVWGIACGVLLALGGGLGGLAFVLYRRVTRAIPANRFGLCSGFAPPDAAKPPPLTTWFADLLDDFAGNERSDEKPLTFADLWTGPPSRADELGESERWLNLEMMTTNLTHRRPHRLPVLFDRREFFFDPREFGELFPERVVKWMVDHPPSPPTTEKGRRRWLLTCLLMLPRLPLPDAELPVVVAARLSLSFPLLMSAVPLWAFDMTLEKNKEALRTWREWADENNDELEWLWEAGRTDPSVWERARAGRACPAAETCWFSDGGISSNFPVHFFDAPIPRWPTFAINLKPFHPDHQNESVWLPGHNRSGILENWTLFDPKPGPKRLFAFASAIVRTMQNHVDNAQMRAPGYRDRVVHISHTETEGGMNLTMRREVVLALAERGKRAAEKLVARFAMPPTSPKDLSWANHRWVRYRSTMAVLEEMLERLRRGYAHPPDAGELRYADLILRDRETPPDSYRWRRADQRDVARLTTQRVMELAQDLQASAESLAEGAPEPQPEARIVPRT